MRSETAKEVTYYMKLRFETIQDIHKSMHISPTATLETLKQMLSEHTIWVKLETASDVSNALKIEGCKGCESSQASMNVSSFVPKINPESDLIRLDLTVELVKEFIRECEALITK